MCKHSVSNHGISSQLSCAMQAIRPCAVGVLRSARVLGKALVGSRVTRAFVLIVFIMSLALPLPPGVTESCLVVPIVTHRGVVFGMRLALPPVAAPRRAVHAWLCDLMPGRTRLVM